jgi:hypothetical protein
LSAYIRDLAGATINNTALFAGGFRDDTQNITDLVTTYNNSLTRGTATNLGQSRTLATGASNSKFALFPGGNSGASSTTFVDAYNTSLARSSPTVLSSARNNNRAVNILDTIIVGGGFIGFSPFYVAAVDAYDENLTRSTPTAFSFGRYSYGGAQVGDYVLFAGGEASPSSQNNSVEVYQQSLISSGYNLTTPTLSDFNITYKYDFTNIGTGTASEGQTLSGSTAFTGTLEFPENIS